MRGSRKHKGESIKTLLTGAMRQKGSQGDEVGNQSPSPGDETFLFKALSVALGLNMPILMFFLSMDVVTDIQSDASFQQILLIFSLIVGAIGFIHSRKTLTHELIRNPNNLSPEGSLDHKKVMVRIFMSFIIGAVIIEGGAILGFMHGIGAVEKDTSYALILFALGNFVLHVQRTFACLAESQRYRNQ